MEKEAIVQKLEEILLRKAKEALTEISADLIFPVIEDVVKSSKTPIDDMVLAALEPQIKEAFAKLLGKI